MPKFYCEYCGIYLTHSSPSGRSQHAKGRKHINNRIEYYKQVIEDLIKENQDKQKQMQSGQSMSSHPQPLYPGAFQNLHSLPLQQLNQLKAGGIQQVQINSTQQQQGNAPPLQPPLPILQNTFINMPKPGGPAIPPNMIPGGAPGANVPPLRPGQQPPLGPPLGVPPNANMIQPGLMPPGGMKPLPGMPPMGPPPVGMMPPPGAPQMMGVLPNLPPMGMMPPPHHLGALLNPLDHNKGEHDDKK